MMESETPPPTSSPHKADDSEVSSRRVPLNQEVTQGTKEAVPEGGSQSIRASGADDNKGPGLSGSQPTVILETGEQIPSKDGCAPRAASGDPETPDILRDMLQKASFSGEQCTLMGTMIEKISSAKSRLNEAFMSLLKGFEVCDIMFSAMFHLQRCACVQVVAPDTRVGFHWEANGGSKRII